MAIKKMKMMQLVAPLDELTETVVRLFHTGQVQLVNAYDQILSYTFTIPATQENLAKTVDMAQTTSFEKEDRVGARRQEILSYLGLSDDEMEMVFDTTVRTNVLSAVEEDLLQDLRDQKEAIARAEKKLAVMQEDHRILRLLAANEIDVQELSRMENFSYRIGSLTGLGRKTLRQNYSRVPAAILHLGRLEAEEVYLLVYPNTVEEEVHRLQEVVNWKPLILDETTFAQEKQDLSGMEAEEEAQERIIEEEKAALEAQIQSHRADLIHAYYAIALDDALYKAKEDLARGRRYFYLSAWVKKEDEAAFTAAINETSDVFLQFRGPEEVQEQAPTKIENHGLFRPFESLVALYGIPNYRELDPTKFFAITYVLLFGAMFGDVGQGLVFFLAGLLLRHKGQDTMGGILARIGLGSTVFGFLYGSVFGLEELIPALLIRPFENINQVLISAIVFGIGLTVISYAIGIVNRLRLGNREEAFFGAEGLCGLVLFTSVIGLVAQMVLRPIVPTALLAGLALLAILGLLFKEPLARLLQKERPLYRTSPGDYYVQSVFSLVETLISIFSAAISFVRVGAFAINHVGLFMAFQTMGQMIGGAGNAVMLVIGNIVILALEGLIVLIQGLRLEYYEMFGKYYTGDGSAFVDSRAALTRPEDL